MSVDERISALREYREGRYQELVSATYKRRGWDHNGIPTLETLERLKIDYPEVVSLVKSHQVDAGDV
jgi:aldehyde:ferredoxin oxidoreductase